MYPKHSTLVFPFISQELSNIAWIRHLRTMFPVLFFIFLFLNVSLSIESAARDIPQMSVSEYFDIKVFFSLLLLAKIFPIVAKGADVDQLLGLSC